MQQLPMFERKLDAVPCPLVVPPMTKRPIVLLDLNYTLVGNSPLKKTQRGITYRAKIGYETYRDWLIELLDGYFVILWTVRFETYRDVTLERIQALTGWQPDLAIFNPTDSYQAHEVKAVYLAETILPRFGPPSKTPYIALESNHRTRSMLKENHIPAIKVPDDRKWLSLPGNLLPPTQQP